MAKIFGRDRRAGSLRTAVLVIALVLALSLGACCGSGGSGGSAPTTADYYGYDSVAVEPMPTSMPAAPMAAMDDRDRGFGMESMAYDDIAYKEAMAEEEGEGYGAPSLSGGAANVQSGRKLTFSASMSINTKTFDADYVAINDLVARSGGYVAHENTSDYSSIQGHTSGRSAWLSVRVPATGYDSFLDELSGIGEVVNKNKSSNDLTSQYFDTEARIEMLELRKERLMGYLVEAEDAADIVEFERELSNVLYELDSYQGNKRHLDQLVDFSMVDINLTELITPETIGKDGEPLGSRASEAFALSSINVERFLEGFVVFMAAALPVIVLIVVIAVIVLVIVWACRKGSAKLRARFGWEKKPKKVKAPHSAYPQPPYQQPPYGQQPQQQQAPQQPQAPQEAQAQQPQAQEEGDKTEK